LFAPEHPGGALALLADAWPAAAWALVFRDPLEAMAAQVVRNGHLGPDVFPTCLLNVCLFVCGGVGVF
jgi:hypothetical protein